MHLFLTLNRFHALFSVSIVHIVEQVNIRWDLNRHHCTDHQRLGSSILIVKSGRICYFPLVSLILYELVYCQLDRCWSEPIKYTAKHKMYHIPVDHENSEISLLGSVREAFLFLNINVTFVIWDFSTSIHPNNTYDALCNFVLFAQFRKHENTHGTALLLE